jgi:8-oxo-dGTP diphosphatase
MKKGVDYPGITVCCFLHDGKGNVLMNKRSVNCRDEHGRWDICGGGVEFGDTLEQTVRKEIAEEFGASALHIEPLGHREIHRTADDGQKSHWIGFDFKVLIDPSEVVNNEPHKFDEVKWFPVSDMPEPQHSQFPVFFAKYQAQLFS